MKYNMFNECDRTLLVGEGNFSFAVALFDYNFNIDIFATCYESKIEQDFAKKNIEYLQDNGVRVLLGVDATKLEKHPMLQSEIFNKIIFNFPHIGGKMRIEKNRELLKQFFLSASTLLQNNGQILVTLCNGQGGTLIDNPPRRWDDSWKVTDMAAHGNFILIAVEPFAWSYFQNYVVTGYRSLNKQFHTDGALTHIFIKSESPNIKNIAPKKKIEVFPCYDCEFSWEYINGMICKSCIKQYKMYAHSYTFDITFGITEKFDTAQFYILLYNHAGLIINNVNFIKSYKTSEKAENRTYRISYKSGCLPLFRQRVIDIHHNLIPNILEKHLNVTVPR